ncbi:hypothetical protein ACP70R_005733 [Stipagrostis hirtigluma subsp. patula]
MDHREPAASPFRDLSNLRTPKPNPKPATPRFFTASKTPFQAPTPTPLRRRRPGAAGPTPTPLGRRLRALEVDQSRSARRAESGRERALRAFAVSASSWLSLLLRDPSACGCSAATGSAAAQPCAAGKRDALDGERPRGPSPKRRRGGDRAGASRKGMTPAMSAALRDSLREACSLDDVTERMGRYMSKEACEEVLVMMCQICKNIDDGRLKMKTHCPLVTDLRLKDNAIRTFMCYNPEWLRIGLHIVLGGDTLLPNGSGKRDKDVSFLKLILEKQMFAQTMTAKSFAHHKVVQGPRRQDSSEALGNIILKRIFLLVAALDTAKIESALPLETGIDGHDGGSPLLFSQQNQIKSSRQIIQESLGEPALSEYDFTIRSIFEDLQDGIILCRVVQLLLSDASIMLKVIAPSDMHKKKLHNCTLAIHYIKQAGVPLSDSDGVIISAEDIATGDKELILSLLWNMFIHMQIPLLADKASLARELTRLKLPVKEHQMTENKSHITLLYDWVQLICSKYGMSVECSSQFDRSALNCLINYYLNINFHTTPLKETLSSCRKELFSCHEPDSIADITSKFGKEFADFLQDIPASGILANDLLLDDKSATVFLAFLSAHLINDKRLRQLKNSISMRLDHQSPEIKLYSRRNSQGKNAMKFQFPQADGTDGSCTNKERAATIIQARARCIIAVKKYCKLKKAVCILQGAMKAWSAVTMKSIPSCVTIAASTSTPWQVHGNYNSYFIFIIERHRFVRMKKSAIMIQQTVRIWIRRRKSHEENEPFRRHEFVETISPSRTVCIASNQEQLSGEDKNTASTASWPHCQHVNMPRASTDPEIPYFDDVDYLDSDVPLQLGHKQSNSVTSGIQLCKSARDSVPSPIPPPSPQLSMVESSCTVSCQLGEVETSSMVSATKLLRKDEMDCSSNTRASFQHEQPVTTEIDFPFCKETVAAQTIQFAYRRFLHNKYLRISAAIKIQSFWRGLLVRKCFTRQIQAIVAIQTVTRQILCHRAFQQHRLAAVLIQRVARGWLARKTLLGSSSLQTYKSLRVLDQSQHRRFHGSLELKIKQFNRTFCSIKIIQRWWRKVLFLEARKRGVIVIQAHFRGWIARKTATRNRKCIIKIQSYVKAYLVRKASKEEVARVRSRLQKSSAQVDDSMRLINRLKAALKQLLHCRKISSIRQTCAILSTATEYSEKCCETLVNFGAADILLKQIHLLNRGIPDQEVLKQVLLTLRNIARYPNLRPMLVNTPESVEIIFQELLRNKADGFFIVSDILKKLCESNEGYEAARALQGHIKGLRNLVQNLEKKVELDKRNGRSGALKENNLRRLGEAAKLYHLLTC